MYIENCTVHCSLYVNCTAHLSILCSLDIPAFAAWSEAAAFLPWKITSFINFLLELLVPYLKEVSFPPCQPWQPSPWPDLSGCPWPSWVLLANSESEKLTF